MTFKSSRLCLLLWPLSVAPAFSAAIQNLTFTDVVKDVTVINVATKQESPAKAGDVLVPPNVLKTGPDSRAELIAEDKTVTRVGSNTIFSVEADSRDVNIAQGSVLFNSPKGKGGGRIKSAGATASVLGTTLIVGANQAGGFKVMLLEGKGQVNGAKGGAAKLSPGQMSFAMPGKPPTAPLNFELKGSVANSKLVGGFSKPLASIAKIEAAVNVQQSKIASGALQTTGMAIGDQPGVAIVVDTALVTNVVAKATAEIKAVAKAVATAKAKIAQKVVEQAPTKPPTPTPRGDQPDPLFMAALLKDLSLNTSFAPQESIFSIDGSGSSRVGYMISKDVPQSQKPSGNPDTSTLIGKNIDLKLSPLDSSTSEIFLHSPFETKDASAIVALQDLKISGNIEFTGFDNVRTFPNFHGIPVFPGASDTLISDGKYTVMQLSSAFGLEKGFAVTGDGIPNGTYIKDIDYNKNTITLSQEAKLPEPTTGSFTSLSPVPVTAKANSSEVILATDTTNFDTLYKQLVVGMKVSNTYFPSGTVITKIADDPDPTHKAVIITLSKPATGSASTSINLESITDSFTVFSRVPVTPKANSNEVTLGKDTPDFETLYKQLVVGMKVSNEYFPSGTVITKIADDPDPTHKAVIITLSKPSTIPDAAPLTTSLNLGGQPVDISGLLQVDAVKDKAEVTIRLRTDGSVTSDPVAGLLVGMAVRSAYFPDGTVIESIGDGKITLSKAATTSTPAGGGDLVIGGIQSGTPLILSAGHTLIIEPGSLIKAATSLLDIYAAGTEFAADLTLAAKVDAAKKPLVLDRVSIENEWPLDASRASGAVRITAPQINILDSRIRAADIKMEAFDGDITISSNNFRGTIATEGDVSKITVTNAGDLSKIKVGQIISADGLPDGTKVTAINGSVITLSKKATADSTSPVKLVTPLPLGITDIDNLAVNSYTLSLKASGNLTLNNVPLYTVNSTFEAGGAISLSGVDIRFLDFQQDQTLTVLAKKGDLTIENSNIDDTKPKNSKLPALVTASLTANEGNVTLKDVELGSVLDVQDVPTKTRFDIISEKADLLVRALTNKNTSIYADTILLSAKGNIKIWGNIVADTHEGVDAPVTIGPTDSTLGSLNIFAKTGGVDIINADLRHATVNITAGGDLVMPIAARGSVPSAAQERNQINLNGVLATNAQRVSLDATTIVLKDVIFKGDSSIFLNSYHGLVAAYPGQGKDKVPGMVNFISNVKYGDIKIEMPSASVPMNDAAFQKAAAAASLGDISKIWIGTQTGDASKVLQPTQAQISARAAASATR